MRQFLNVFKFELTQILKQKSFILTILFTSLIIFGMTFVPRFIGNFGGEVDTGSGQEYSEDNENIEDSGDDSYKDSIALLLTGEVNESTIKSINDRYKVVKVDNESDIEKLLNDQEVTKGIVLNSDLNAKVITKDLGMFALEDDTVKSLLEENYKYNIALEQEGISRESYEKIENITAEVLSEDIGKNTLVGYALSYVALMFLYFTILMQGNGVATDVAKEKDSRTMEILVTNVKSKYLIWGKVMARAIVTLIQLAAIILAGFIGYKINGGVSPVVANILKSAFESVRSIDLIILSIFALTGVIMYYFLFAAFGSLVNKVDQLPQTLSPVTMLIVIGFMVPMFSMSMPNSIVMKIGSYVPFTSPLAIFPRYLMTSMPTVDILISYGILVLSTLILAWLSVKIYRHGTLNYGNKLNIWKLLTSKN